jgi:hypothetical protein
MADILINSGNNNVNLQFEFNSPQQFFYTVELIDDTGKQYFHDTGSWNTKTNFDLGITSGLIGKYLTIDWTVIDPAGAGNNFSATATAIQAATPKANSQNCTGTTSATHASLTTIGKFIQL